MFKPLIETPDTVDLDQFLSFCLGSMSKTFVYRGQASHAWSLTPSGFRDATGALCSDVERQRRIVQFQSPQFQEGCEELIELVENGEQAKSGLKKSDYSRLQLFVVAQHFGAPTPLLDWTQSPLIAAFMATFGSQNDQTIGVFRLDRSAEPAELIYSDYSEVSFRRIRAQRGGVSTFGVLDKGNLNILPMTIEDYVSAHSATYASGAVRCFVDKVCVSIRKKDRERLEDILTGNGVEIETMFPGSGYWKAQSIRQRLGI